MELGNQQERTVSVPFVAGLAVGEGTFYLAVQKVKNNKIRITPGFNLVMNDEETIELAARCLTDNGIGVYREKRKDGGCVIHCGGMLRSLAVANLLMPNLTGTKRAAAQKLVEFVESRMAAPKSAPYSEEEKQFVRDLRNINGNKNLPRNTL